MSSKTSSLNLWKMSPGSGRKKEGSKVEREGIKVALL